MNCAFEFLDYSRSSFPHSSHKMRAPCGTYIAGAFALERWFRGGAAASRMVFVCLLLKEFAKGPVSAVLGRTKESLVTAADWGRQRQKAGKLQFSDETRTVLSPGLITNIVCVCVMLLATESWLQCRDAADLSCTKIQSLLSWN